MSEIRLCVLCRHFDSKYEHPGGGCDTCGYGAGNGLTFDCKRHYFGGETLSSHADFYDVIRTAATCGDFAPLSAEEIAAI